jgi:hypothetical protein
VVTRTVRAATAAILLFAVAGCREETTTSPAATGDAAEVGDEVSILRKFPPSASGGYAAAAQEIHRDAASFAAAWKKANAHLAPIPAPPAVDFAKEMVALVALGQKTNGGWSVEIVGLRKTESGLRVLYAVRQPAPGAMTAAVMTNPWHAVVLMRHDGAVEWSKY